VLESIRERQASILIRLRRFKEIPEWAGSSPTSLRRLKTGQPAQSHSWGHVAVRSREYCDGSRGSPEINAVIALHPRPVVLSFSRQDFKSLGLVVPSPHGSIGVRHRLHFAFGLDAKLWATHLLRREAS
jgi:hypothetical protein